MLRLPGRDECHRDQLRANRHRHSSAERSSSVATCRRVMTQHWPSSNCHGLITVSACSHSSMTTIAPRPPSLRTGRTDRVPAVRSSTFSIQAGGLKVARRRAGSSCGSFDHRIAIHATGRVERPVPADEYAAERVGEVWLALADPDHATAISDPFTSPAGVACATGCWPDGDPDRSAGPTAVPADRASQEGRNS